MKITPLPGPTTPLNSLALGVSGAAAGDTLIWNSTTNTWTVGVDSGIMVPYRLLGTDTFIVPLYKQALFEEIIELDAGAILTVDGYLIMVT